MTELRDDLQPIDVPRPAPQPEAPGAQDVAEERRFAELFHAHVDAVRRTLVHLGVWERDVDDAAQRVFVIVSDKLDDYDAERGPLRPWILGIAANVARDWRKWASSQRVRAIHLVADASQCDEHTAGRSSPDDDLHRRRMLRLLGELLDTLPDEQRVVFVMCVIEAVSARDASATLGVPVNTVSSRLRLAREKLQAAIALAIEKEDAR